MTPASVLVVHASAAAMRGDWVLVRYLHREAIASRAIELWEMPG